MTLIGNVVIMIINNIIFTLFLFFLHLEES